MMCKSCYGKLCPVSLAIALGVTAMLSLWVMFMWGAYTSGETSSAYMQHIMAGMEGLPIWKLYLSVFLKAAFFGFFIALFYDLCRMLCWKMCKKTADHTGCDCTCTCCSGKKPANI